LFRVALPDDVPPNAAEAQNVDLHLGVFWGVNRCVSRRSTPMALKELEVRYATKRAKDYKLADGEGL
jgi:hypothetical protein